MNISELLDELQSAAWDVGNARDHQISDATEAERKARSTVDAAVKALQARIAELEAAAYAQTDKGPALWRDVCQMEVDAHELSRSSGSPQGRRIAELEQENKRLHELLKLTGKVNAKLVAEIIDQEG